MKDEELDEGEDLFQRLEELDTAEATSDVAKDEAAS
jgi:hypothetical protein